MKIKLLKAYLGKNIDDVIEVTDNRGKYLIRTGVGVFDKKETKPKVFKFKEPYSMSEGGTKGIVYRKTPEEADTEIKSLNKFK